MKSICLATFLAILIFSTGCATLQTTGKVIVTPVTVVRDTVEQNTYVSGDDYEGRSSLIDKRKSLASSTACRAAAIMTFAALSGSFFFIFS